MHSVSVNVFKRQLKYEMKQLLKLSVCQKKKKEMMRVIKNLPAHHWSPAVVNYSCEAGV